MKRNENKVIFFDLFDTLVRVDRGYLEPYFDRETDRLGDNGTLKNAQQTIERLVEMHPQLTETRTIEEMANDYNGFMARSLNTAPQHVLDMLADLKSQGYQLCVISDAAFVDIAAWDQSPLAQYFDETVFSCEVGLIKPDPRLFEYAKQAMGYPLDCVFVGDGGHEELTAAQRANMHTVKAEWFNNRRLEEIYKHAEFKLPETQQVLGTVQSINFELTRQPANELMAICDMASGMTDPNNPMMDAEYLAGWIDNHRSEVLGAIEAGMFHMDDVVNVLSSKYDVGLMRGPEIDLDNTGFDDRDDRS